MSAPAGPGTTEAPERPESPLRSGLFRMVWLAALASNLGSWMHLVAAGWLMTSLTVSAALVALLQSASALPSFALALPAGAMADVFDRRRMILVTQAAQLLVALLLGVLTLADLMTPGLLLALTLLLGAASTAGLPAYSAITPEIVRRDQLPAAISLNAVASTAAQSVGPALGGLLVAGLGPGAVFLLNAASFVAVVVAIGRWRRVVEPSALPPEHVVSAVRTGARYALNAPELIAVLVRCGAYVVAYSALPALLVLVTRERLGGGAGQYGLLLAMLGVGGVAGALLLPRARRRVGTDVLVVGATIAQVAVLVALSEAQSVAMAVPVLLVAGVAGMAVISSLTIAAQEALPDWVRGRGLAIFQLVFQLGYAGGAAAWGALAASTSLPTALQAGGAVLAIGTLLTARLRLSAADEVDVSRVPISESYVPVDLDLDDGPVVMQREYDIGRERADAIDAIAPALRRARRREGALGWALLADVERPDVYLESYTVASWSEHRRQGERRTADDQRAIDGVAALDRGGAAAPRVLVDRSGGRRRFERRTRRVSAARTAGAEDAAAQR